MDQQNIIPPLSLIEHPLREAALGKQTVQYLIPGESRAKAAAVYEELGIDLPTAIRMFLKRSVVVNGVPFSMTLPKQEYRAERAIRAVQSLSEAAQQNGTADMSLDEINAEIAASRADRASRNARNGA